MLEKSTNKTWWKESVVYQIYPRSFMDSNGDGIGDLNGITLKLDYLKSLGIDVIWICPMFKSPNDDNGYDISDYQDVMDEFGDMEDFDRLLSEVHQRKMKLILDLVPNHTSDEHPWFIESRMSKESPKRDWYIWRDDDETNNWESIFKGSAWQHDELSGQSFLHLFSSKQPDLNWENRDVREAIYRMICWWLDKGIDGFRIDAISHIKKEPGLNDMPNPNKLAFVPAWKKMMNVDGIVAYLDEMCANTFNHYDVMTVGEANGVSAEQAKDWVGEDHKRLNMIFQFDHLKLWEANPEAQLDLVALKKIFSCWQDTLHHVGWNALFVENHDIPRIVSKWGDTERYWYQSATAIATMYFLMEGTPFIYQGQEIGMTNSTFNAIEDFDCVDTKNRYRQEKEQGKQEEDIILRLAKTTRDNARTPMQWDTSGNAGFTSGIPWLRVNPNYQIINVASQDGDQHSVLHFYRQLIQLRKSELSLVYGRYNLLMENHSQVYAYTRTLDSQCILVLCNMTSEIVHDIDIQCNYEHLDLLLGNYHQDEPLVKGSFVLQPFEAKVYRCC